MLAVEGILALDNAHMGAVTQILTGSLQGSGDGEVRHCRELNGGIFQRGVFKPDGAGGHHYISGADLHINTAAGAHPDKGVGANGRQLLHGDGGGGAADSGGADGNLFSQQRAGIDIVLPVHSHMMGIVKMRCNGLAPSGIPGEKHIPAHIPFLTADVKLHTNILHKQTSLFSCYFIIR